MYYRIALIANVEPHESNEAWRCYEDLKLAGHAVEVLSPDLYPGIIDDDGIVDLGMLAKFMEVFRPDYIAKAGETAESILLNLKSRNVRGSGSPVRHFVVYGYVGKDNFGDELIFNILHSRLAERYPGSFVTLIGHGPERALERHGVSAMLPSVEAGVSCLLNGASALIFMAGLMFDSGFDRGSSGLVEIFQNQRGVSILAALTQLAYLNDVPVVYAGIGAGPLDTLEARKHIKLASLTRPSYITRDAATTELLLQSGVDPSLVSEKADLAFLTQRPGLAEGIKEWPSRWDFAPGEFVLVSLRDCENLASSLVDVVARSLDWCYKAHGMRAVFANLAPEDEVIHRRVIEEMNHPEAVAAIEDTRFDFDQAFELISSARLVLAMRLHASILAHAFGIPSIGLDYNDKVAAFYKKMGQGDFVLPLTCTEDDLFQAVQSVLLNYDRLSLEINARAQENRGLAEEAMLELFAVIGDSLPTPQRQSLYGRLHSREKELLCRANERERTLRAEKTQLACELTRVKREREEALRSVSMIKKTTTWKVGKVLMTAPRAIKRFFAN